jgi:short-subunit dehydrogenase
VVCLSERLRAELAPAGVGVSVLCPGLVQTEIGANARRLQPVEPGVPLSDNPVFRSLREKAPVAGMSADRVGEFVLEAVRANRAYIFTHPEIRPFVEDRQRALLADFGASADPDRPLQPGWEAWC